MTVFEESRTFRTAIGWFVGLFLVRLILSGTPSSAADPGDGFTYLGNIRPRHAREIEASNWSVGAETMDRDYTIYSNWRNYLGPLGVKQARIQSGWAKTERKKGEYDFVWLDKIIPDMVHQGVKPWVCLCYGNPIYEGGGGTGLAGGLPSSPEAIEAWCNYVAATVKRYQTYVDQWEIWNEPRSGRGRGAETYAEFAARTAEVIRNIQPDAELMYAAGGSFDAVFVKDMLSWFENNNKISLVNEIVYHPYSYNPDDSYGRVAELRKIVRSFSDKIILRQNENGVPSRRGSFGAVSNYDWTELRQAKWATRRLMGDLGRDIPSSYFAICEMAYRVREGGKDSDFRDNQGNLEIKINSKGLLEIHPDRTIHHAKLAYRTVQHITALFDNNIKRIPDFQAKLKSESEDSKHTVFGYKSREDALLVTIWRSSDRPGAKPKLEPLTLTIAEGRFVDPVWVDLVSGGVYDIDNSLWNSTGTGCAFQRLPVYDSVIVVTERAAVRALLATD